MCTERITLTMKRLLLAALLAVTLTACNRTPERLELEELFIEVPYLITERPEYREIPAAQWPRALKQLEPKRVCVNAEGLYIVTSSFFVREQGVFAPRTGVKLKEKGDPSYDPIGYGFYSYRIEG